MNIIRVTDANQFSKFNSTEYYGWRVYHSDEIQKGLKQGPGWLESHPELLTTDQLDVYVLEGPEIGECFDINKKSGTEIIFIFVSVDQLKGVVVRRDLLDYGRVAKDLIDHYRRLDGFYKGY